MTIHPRGPPPPALATGRGGSPTVSRLEGGAWAKSASMSRTTDDNEKGHYRSAWACLLWQTPLPLPPFASRKAGWTTTHHHLRSQQKSAVPPHTETLSGALGITVRLPFAAVCISRMRQSFPGLSLHAPCSVLADAHAHEVHMQMGHPPPPPPPSTSLAPASKHDQAFLPRAVDSLFLKKMATTRTRALALPIECSRDPDRRRRRTRGEGRAKGKKEEQSNSFGTTTVQAMADRGALVQLVDDDRPVWNCSSSPPFFRPGPAARSAETHDNSVTSAHNAPKPGCRLSGWVGWCLSPS